MWRSAQGLARGPPGTDAAVALVSAQVDVPCCATAGGQKEGALLKPLAAQQDVRGQTTRPTCVIWGKSLAFAESVSSAAQWRWSQGPPTCCRR